MPITDRDKLHTFLVAQFNQAYESDAMLLVKEGKNGHPRLILEDVKDKMDSQELDIYEEMKMLDSACVQWAIKAVENFRMPISHQVKTGGNAKSRAKKAEKAAKDRELRMQMRGRAGQKPPKGKQHS